jgi:hypothetical protein
VTTLLYKAFGFLSSKSFEFWGYKAYKQGLWRKLKITLFQQKSYKPETNTIGNMTNTAKSNPAKSSAAKPSAAIPGTSISIDGWRASLTTGL